MEITRKEILNSSEYWQERAETQCFIEHIDCTIQLADKQQLIDKAAQWFRSRFPNMSNEAIEKFKEDMKGE